MTGSSIPDVTDAPSQGTPLWAAVAACLPGPLDRDELHDILLPSKHSLLVDRRRAALVLGRARAVALMFSVFTLVWIVIDWFVFPWPIWASLAAGRVFISGAFLATALLLPLSGGLRVAYRAIAYLMILPSLFYLYSLAVIDLESASGLKAMLAAGYAFVPFVVVSGLAIFPLTALEGALFAAAPILSVVAAAALRLEVMAWASYLAVIWLLLILAVVATIAGMGQMHFMAGLVRQSAHDVLTNAFSRRYGEELLAMHFSQAKRSGAPLSLMFLDIDNFKSINDTFGHEAGDDVLRDMAQTLREKLRQSDIVVRWGGEEFVVVMPQTDSAGAATLAGRLLDGGLGTRPDGAPLTASMGIAEHAAEADDSIADMVEAADRRMYVAKRSGKNRVVADDAEAGQTDSI
ncbi:MAG: diguanylate cyclase [Alphaproteobacteria bacterium]|nr:diguanylate cyclase [Alphaproteobacteria bacterium]